jgi:predicted signal transduction protein with EAL and GGDEF domain
MGLDALNWRASDSIIPGTLEKKDESLARFGGDEFILLLPEIRQGEDAGIVARRVLDALVQPVNLAGHEITVSGSIGIAVYPEDGQDAESLLKNADMAMYFAKRASGNDFRFLTAAMNAAALKRLTMEKHLRLALELNELSLHYVTWRQWRNATSSIE